MKWLWEDLPGNDLLARQLNTRLKRLEVFLKPLRTIVDGLEIQGDLYVLGGAMHMEEAVLDGLLTVEDTQSPNPVERIRFGKLGPGLEDYGIEVYDAAGALILGSDGLGPDTVGADQIIAGSVQTSHVAFTVVDGDNIVGTINATTEGIRIDAGLLHINGSTLFTAGYDPSTKETPSGAQAKADAAEADAINAANTYTDAEIAAGKAAVSVIIRATSAPTQRPDGTALRVGDLWIDTDDGNAPYSYNGSSWIRAYTRIDGGYIVTGLVDAQRVSISSASTFAAGYNPFTKTQTIRSTTAPTQRPDGTTLQTGDIWIDTDDGDAPYTRAGNGTWVRAYTRIDGGNIVTGTVHADRIAAVNLSAIQANVTTLSSIVAHIGTVTAGILRNSTSTTQVNLNSTGTGAFITTPNITIRADGSMTMGSHFTLTAGGDATFSGALSAASGTFAGNLSAAGGTFAGDLQAATGSFSGLVALGSSAASGHRIRLGTPALAYSPNLGIGFDTTSGDGGIYIGKSKSEGFFYEAPSGVGDSYASMRASRLGFFSTAPVTKPTGVAVTAAGIHAALTSLGLIS